MADGRFERVAVLGLGLLGGSVALAARERGAARDAEADRRTGRRGQLQKPSTICAHP